jgi:hypothetical protein
MSFRKVLFVMCLIISLLCLATGYGIAGYWVGAAIAMLMGPAWWLAQKYPYSSLPSACLSMSVGLAVVGSLIGCLPLLMIFGSAAALAAWDLIFLLSAVGNNSSGEQNRRYENRHLQSLLMALGFALLAIALGRFVNIQLPFIVLLLSLAFILFALDRAGDYIKKRPM